MIKNTLNKSKAELRAEGEQAVAEFLAKGGVIEFTKPRKTPRGKMASKATKQFRGATAPRGFTTSSFWR